MSECFAIARRAMLGLVLLVATWATCSASSVYEEYYTKLFDTPLATQEPADAPIRFEVANEVNAAILAWERRGYLLIGFSEFSSGKHLISKKRALEWGEEVGAHLVVQASHYTRTEHDTSSITLPSINRSKGTVWTPDGPAPFSGRTYGTETTTYSTDTDLYDTQALYFVKTRGRFGVVLAELSDEIRKQRQSNKGVRVRSVIDNSPAFFADVVTDDVFLAVNGKPIYKLDDIVSVLWDPKVQQVELLIGRGRTEIKKTIKLLPAFALPIIQPETAEKKDAKKSRAKKRSSRRVAGSR